MLKVRVIPCLDVHDGRVVKGVNFIDLVDAGDPVEAARAYDAAGADERVQQRRHGQEEPFGHAARHVIAGRPGHRASLDRAVAPLAQATRIATK